MSTKITASEAAAIRLAIADGLTMSEICGAFNRSDKPIRKIAKNAGLTIKWSKTSPIKNPWLRADESGEYYSSENVREAYIFAKKLFNVYESGKACMLGDDFTQKAEQAADAAFAAFDCGHYAQASALMSFAVQAQRMPRLYGYGARNGTD